MEKYINENVQELANKIKMLDYWDTNLCAALCDMAGMLNEWKNTDPENSECVIFAAAEKLGVEII